MLRTLLRLLTAAPQAPRRIESIDGRSVVLYAHVDATAHPPKRPPKVDAISPVGHGNHRAWLLSMRLDHLRLCSRTQAEQLSALGIVTAGDLLACDLSAIALRLDERSAIRTLKRLARAIQLAASVPGMMPRDALLLISIHRRSIRSLASESPAIVHRDLQRFALSSKGQRALRGRRLPSLKRIRRWIDACVEVTSRRNLHAAI